MAESESELTDADRRALAKALKASVKVKRPMGWRAGYEAARAPKCHSYMIDRTVPCDDAQGCTCAAIQSGAFLANRGPVWRAGYEAGRAQAAALVLALARVTDAKGMHAAILAMEPRDG